jgi:hypothetical protein
VAAPVDADRARSAEAAGLTCSDQQALSVGVGLSSPNSGRNLIPTQVPASAKAAHNQPLRLPLEMPPR